MKTAIIAAFAAAAVATPAVAQESYFGGGRVEAVVGYDSVDLNVRGASNPDGVVYGVAGGYDFQSGGVVYGIEGELTDSGASQRYFGGSKVSAARDIYVGGRVGFVSGPALIYGKVGYTNARMKFRNPTTSFGENYDGIRAGVGVEYSLGGNLFGKAEYRYSNYEDGLERNQAVAGIGMRF